MAKLPSSLEKLIHEFSKLPGIGPKTAQRLAFFVLKGDRLNAESLAAAIAGVGSDVKYCSVCHTMADTDPCPTCSDPLRDRSLICVVEESLDVLALDKTGYFKGLFHVLGGALNPLEGVGPDQLNVESLLNRLRSKADITEVVLATNPSLEGETTAMHLAKVIKQLNLEIAANGRPEIKLTRIARGLPMGGDLEYADDITLTRAMEGRREY